ncbi:MAG: hypothetical protein PVH21_05075 [Myxococcales bacterium]|jgi:hypothetical protein
MNASSLRVCLAACALIALVGCYSNNGGLIDLDGGLGDGGSDGGDGGPGGGGAGGTGGTGGTAGGAGAGGQGGAAGTGAGGSGGNPLTGQWQIPVIIDSHDGIGVHPKVAMGANGEAFAVWVQSSLGEYKVWANRYSPMSGWEGDVLLGATDGSVSDPEQTSQPDVVVDDDGIATAAWANYSDPVVRGLVSQRYVAPDGWGDPGTIYDGASTGGDARLAVDAAGNVMAVFETGTGAWANRFETTSGWGTAEIIDDEPNTPRGIQIGLQPDGAGWAVWSQAPTGVLSNIFGNQFSPDTGWATASKIEEGTMSSALDPQLAISATGEVLFVWQRTSGLAFHVWANGRRAADAELTTPKRLDNSSTAYVPQVAADPQGNGTAVWIQDAQTASSQPQIAASRYAPASGWSVPVVLAEGDITGEPRVAMDSQGNAIVTYAEKLPQADQADAWAHTYTQGQWSAAVLLGLDEPPPGMSAGTAFQPSLTMSPDGKAVVVWREGSDIWAATFE